MNKPDAYMPFFGNEFFTSVDGQSDTFSRCYLRGIWFYWHHNHCQGLKKDKEYLRGVCHADTSVWDELYELIFDDNQFFTLGEDDLWHQKRCDELWIQAVEKYNKVLARAKAGADARWNENDNKRKHVLKNVPKHSSRNA